MPSSERRTVLGLSDSGAVLTPAIGEAITLSLPESGGTAFIWHVIGGGELIKDDSLVDCYGDLPGASGSRLFAIVAQDSNETKLRLARYRPWESSAQADAEFTLTIKAKPAP